MPLINNISDSKRGKHAVKASWGSGCAGDLGLDWGDHEMVGHTSPGIKLGVEIRVLSLSG